jgi:hypothetical protein
VPAEYDSAPPESEKRARTGPWNKRKKHHRREIFLFIHTKATRKAGIAINGTVHNNVEAKKIVTLHVKYKYS